MQHPEAGFARLKSSSSSSLPAFMSGVGRCETLLKLRLYLCTAWLVKVRGRGGYLAGVLVVPEEPSRDRPRFNLATQIQGRLSNATVP